MHFLRFNNDLQFTFNQKIKIYSIQVEDVLYTMPYVLTLRLKRYLRVDAQPTAQQMEDWFRHLPKTEKSLVSCTPLHHLQLK